MLDKKTIAAGIIIAFAVSAILIPESTAEITYECYYWNLDKSAAVTDRAKDIIICNYPNSTDMYHSYFKEKDMIQDIVINGGGSYTYSGKHPSGVSTFEEWKKK